MNARTNCLLLVDVRPLLGHMASTPHPKGLELEAFVEAMLAGILRCLRVHEPSHCLVVIPEASPDSEGVYAEQPLRMVEEECARRDLRVHRSQPAAANDVLSYFATKALSRGFRSVIAGNDPGLAWASSEGAEVCDPLSLQLLDDAWCIETYGVPTSLLADLLSLTAAPGIGPRMAQALLTRYGSADKIIEIPDSLTERELQLVRAGLQAIQVRQLGLRLNLDLDLKLAPKDLALTDNLCKAIDSMPVARLVRTAPRAKSPI